MQTRAERNIEWIEAYCRVPEGKLAGQPVKLREWQKDEIRKIYDNPNGTRRAILSFGRKNGKTALSAFLLLLHLCGPEARMNATYYSAARSRDQAAILFGLASKCVRQSEDLSDVLIIRDTKKEMACPDLGTLYRALSKEASTALGLSPSMIIHDELGQVKGPRDELYEALETATGAQDNPLSIIISTQAPTDADLLSVLIDDALAGNDPRTVVSLYTATEDMDPFSDEALIAANPAFGDFQNAEETRGMAQDAKRMSSRENEFRNLILNQRVDMSTPFVSRSIWQEGAGPIAEDWGDAPVFGGLDLSEVNDLTALTLKARINGKWHVRPIFWLPEEGLVERSRKDRVPYDMWVRDGWIRTVPGRTIGYDYVAYQVRDIIEQYNVKKLAFDRYNWRHFKPWLVKAGMDESSLEGDGSLFEEFGQGMVSMSPALRTLESIILNGELLHGGNPVLTMCMANAVTASDPAGNRKLNKAKSSGRIDGAVALAMAAGVAGEWDGKATSPKGQPRIRLA